MSKNLGQVSGVFIGTVPPTNTNLIWYDNTLSQKCHKLYDVGLAQWVILKQEIFSQITYSEITNLAGTVGLSIGKFYIITDKGNLLAISITSTKIQYTDLIGNICIDDLGTNIQYHVTSSNLLIDDLAGVFDVTNRKLVFSFAEYVPALADDYVLGKHKIDGVWSLAKFKVRQFLSTVGNNSLSWNGGVYFNFASAIANIKDQNNGIVSKQAFDTRNNSVDTTLGAIAQNYQTLIENFDQAVSDATTADIIYSKAAPALTLTGEPADAATGDTLLVIVSKFQRWIAKLKVATGILLSSTFADDTTTNYITNSDTVDSALRKTNRWIKFLVSKLSIIAGWSVTDYTTDIPNVAQVGDYFPDVASKVAGKFDQIGDITNGVIVSKQKIDTPLTVKDPRTELNLQDGFIEFTPDDVAPASNVGKARFGLNGLYYDKDAVRVASITPAGAKFEAPTFQNFTLPGYESKATTRYGSATLLVKGTAKNADVAPLPMGIYAGISGQCAAIPFVTTADEVARTYGGYFDHLKVGGLALGRFSVASGDGSDIYLTNDASYVTCKNSVATHLYLPSNPHEGQSISIKQSSSSTVTVYGNGISIQANENTVSNYQLNGFGYLAFLMFDGTTWHINQTGLNS